MSMSQMSPPELAMTLETRLYLIILPKELNCFSQGSVVMRGKRGIVNAADASGGSCSLCWEKRNSRRACLAQGCCRAKQAVRSIIGLLGT